jgi:hypothetical protein
MFEVVFGRRGSGKTTLIRAKIPTLKKPVIVIDVLGNFKGYRYNGQTPFQTESLGEAIIELQSWCRQPSKHSGYIIVEPADLNTTIDFMCSSLWAIEGGSLVLDEADAFSLSESPCFDEAIRYGRNRGIDIITGCRRPAEISKNITAAADKVYCLSTREPRDIEYYRDFLGDETAFAVQNLPQWHGIIKDFSNNSTVLFRSDEQGKLTVLKSLDQNTETPLV